MTKPLVQAPPADRPVAGDSRLGLTGAQQGVWLAHELDPSSPVFNTADAVELCGPLDGDALAEAIRAVLGDADALHARFEDGPDGPVQVLAPARDWPLPRLDLRGEANPAAAADAYMAGDLGRAVDLARGPLFATALLRTGEDRWTWYLRIHHIATDAYATALLMRRVAERMTALQPTGGDPRAAPVPRPFGRLADLVAADADYRAGEAHLADRVFWADRLAGHSAPPTLAGRTAGAVPVPARASTILPATTGTTLAAAASATGAGWPELVIAATAANLASLTGARRQVFAMPVLARSGAARRTPGIAVNVIPLAIDVDPGAPLRDVVLAVREELRATRRHQALRFEDLRRMVAADAPLFGPQINLKPYVRELRFGSASGQIRNLATGPVDDLSLIVTDLPGGAFELTLDGNAALYDEVAVRSQLARLVATLEACAVPGALEAPAGALPTITPAERHEVVATFNATAHPVAPTTLTALLREQARRAPELVAVADADESITYGELHARAEALAAELRAHGAGPDAIVGLALHRSVGLSVAVVAVLLAGAAYLPLDPELPADRLAYVIGDAQPSCVVATAASREALPPHPTPELLIDRRGLLRSSPDASAPADSAAGHLLPHEPVPRDAAYVLYTSGSTGRPKGVVTEHAAIVNRLEWMQDALPIGPGDTVLQKTPYGFDVSVWELVWPLLHGARLVMAEPGGHRDPAYLAELIAQESVTTAHFVPSMLGLFLEDRAAAQATNLRQVICSGEALPEPTARRFHEVLPATALHNLYGPTEAAIDVTWWPCEAGAPAGPVPIGRPIWNTRTYVLDEAMRPMPIGVSGELWLAGANLAREYLRRPDLTGERFVRDPLHAESTAAVGTAPAAGAPRMYRTGDLARWRPDGALEYLGRTDDQVKLRGLRIELGEIEATLVRHPAVTAAAASVDGTGRAPRLVAHVVLARGSASARLASGELRAHAAASLPDYMLPAAFGFLNELPLSANGKLERRRLPAIDDDSAGGGHDPKRPPASPVEEVLCELFAEALGLERVAPDARLFDLGGDSLLAAQLAARIRSRLGISLSLGALFASPSPSELAARIHDGTDLGALGPLLTLRAEGDAPALFCLHPAGGIGWCYAGLARTIQDRPIHAIQAPGLQDATMPSTLTALAEAYADRIDGHTPSGPIHLLGWSVGGVLAHATAAALQSRGRTTGVLALLDAYPGEQWSQQPPPTPEETLLALLHMGGLGEPALGGQTPTLERVLEVLTREGSALASLGPETFEWVARTVRESSRLMREHQTTQVDGDLLFFRAAAPRREDWLDATAWAHHVRGELTLRDLDCTHPEMPRPGPLDLIGEAVALALRRAEG